MFLLFAADTKEPTHERARLRAASYSFEAVVERRHPHIVIEGTCLYTQHTMFLIMVTFN